MSADDPSDRIMQIEMSLKRVRIKFIFTNLGRDVWHSTQHRMAAAFSVAEEAI